MSVVNGSRVSRSDGGSRCGVPRHAAPRRVSGRLVAVYVLLGVMVGCGGVHVALVAPGRPLVTWWLVAGVVAGVAAACVAACLDVLPPAPAGGVPEEEGAVAAGEPAPGAVEGPVGEEPAGAVGGAW